MTGLPDGKAKTFDTYPHSPSVYVTVVQSYTLAAGATNTIHDFSDGKIYLLKFLTMIGVVRGKGTTNDDQVTLTVVLANGLNDEGVTVTLCGYRGRCPAESAANLYTPVSFNVVAPTPLLFRAHNGAGQQLLQLVNTNLNNASDVNVTVTVLAWPLN